jgi:uncharacterized phage-associated protein
MGKPAGVLDVAAYILMKHGRLSTWKLQKLCYYAQAWSLVWDEERLFTEPIEAWANGPVVPFLYKQHRGRFHVLTMSQGDAAKLDEDQRDTVDAILEVYGDKPAAWLSALTHRESPWRDARLRAGLGMGERGSAQIRLSDMSEYYDGLYAIEEA